MFPEVCPSWRGVRRRGLRLKDASRCSLSTSGRNQSYRLSRVLASITGVSFEKLTVNELVQEGLAGTAWMPDQN